MNPKEPLLSGALRRSALSYLSEQEKRKYEIARELGVDYQQAYKGNLSARENGYVGGYMVKRLIEKAEKSMAGQ